MTFLHTFTRHELDGTYSVSIMLDNKREYEYTLPSEYDVSRFLILYRKQLYGPALAFLKEHDVTIRQRR